MKETDIILTDDGSTSVYCSEHGEATHSSAGALAETIHHYLIPCEIETRSTKYRPLVVLEMGFGIGHGFALTKKYCGQEKFTFVSFEKNLDFIEYAKTEYPELKNLEQSRYYDLPVLRARFDGADLIIVLGDARENLKKLAAKKAVNVHAIYQDPFSPKRNPRLWTKEWFADLYQLAHEDCIMSTYSASSSVRKAMVESGWKVRGARAFGHKKSFTIATINGVSDQDILDHLQRSPAKAYLDDDFRN